MKTLLVGYGNESRTDDGVGLYVARQIEKLDLADVEIMTCQQLHVDRVEDFLDYDLIILIDASVTGQEIEIRSVESSAKDIIESSHHLGPETIAGLALRLYNKNLPLFVCSILAENFEFGYEFSDSVKKRAERATEKILNFIEKRR